MKKLFKYVIPCLAAAFMLTSCNSTMDDKAAVDARFTQYANPVLNSATATATTFETATATATVESLENVQEVGFQISTDASFSSYESIVCEEVSESFSASFSGLKEETTYYVRSYAFTKTGLTVYGEATSFTTPKSPIFDIEGTYTASTSLLDFDTYEFGPGYSNKVTISYVEGSKTEINITNLYDEGETVIGSYDAETGEIIIPSGQLVMTHDTYGPIVIAGLDNKLNPTDEVTLKFTKLGGKIDAFMWGLVMTGDYQGYFWNVCMTTMSHD